MKSRYFRDALLIFGVLLAAGLIFIFGRLSEKVGTQVEVRVRGELYALLPLSENTELDVDGLCMLKIENGEAYIKSAVCRNQICVGHQPINRSGEAIVCLPSGVTVKITGGDSPDFYV